MFVQGNCEIPELCFQRTGTSKRVATTIKRKNEVQFSAFFPLQFVMLLKFLECMNIKSLFHI